MHFFKRFFQEPKQSFFLFGPRGTGKSTLIRRDFKDALWIDLLKPDLLRTYTAEPERLFGIVRAHHNKHVVIDEIQRIPSLLSVVHSLIEEDRKKQFILTGSSSRKLRRAGADLLGGRALKCALHPFMAAELGDAFSLQVALKQGLLPIIWQAPNPEQSLEAYIGLYLEEEIQSEGLVRNLESFSRFLSAVSFSHASVLNMANISRECAVKRKTVESYLDILEELLLGYRIPMFTKRAQRELSAHPKFYLFDAGVFRTLRPKGIIDSSSELDGLTLEGLVAQHLVAWNDYSRQKHDICFWRTRSGVEVDFIVHGPEGLWAIEVKNSTKVFPADTRSLEAFLTDYPEAKALLLYRGDERNMQKNVLCIPVESFLLKMVPDHSLDQAMQG